MVRFCVVVEIYVNWITKSAAFPLSSASKRYAIGIFCLAKKCIFLIFNMLENDVYVWYNANYGKD